MKQVLARHSFWKCSAMLSGGIGATAAYLALPLMINFETSDLRYEALWPLGLVFAVPLLLIFVAQACVLAATRLEAITIRDDKLRYVHLFGFSVALEDILAVKAEKSTAPSYFPNALKISLLTRNSGVKVIATDLFQENGADLAQPAKGAGAT